MGHLGIRFVYHTCVDVCTPTLLHDAHCTALSAPLFLEHNIKHFVGPDLSSKLVCHSLFGGGGGGGGGGAGPGTANSISRRQRDRVMVHGHGLRSKKPTIRPRVDVVL